MVHDFNLAAGDRLKIDKGLMRGYLDISEDAEDIHIAFKDVTSITLLDVSYDELLDSWRSGRSASWDWLV